jgi:hypothetical protein
MNIIKHLKKPVVELRLLQARIEKSLYEKLRSALKKDSVEIREFMEAAVKAYLEERGK